VETDQGEITAEAIYEMSPKEEANVKTVIDQFCYNRTKLHQLRRHGAGIVCEIPVFGELK
jgi:cyclophilin family peptidyl-prolyl cis-trans isomerase